MSQLLLQHNITADIIAVWLSEQIEPYVRMHQGRVRLVSYRVPERSIELELSGACSTCPFVYMTIQHGIIQRFRDHFGPSAQELSLKVTIAPE